MFAASFYSACTALEWDPLGLVLAIAQANSSVVLLWFAKQWKTRAVDIGVKVCVFTEKVRALDDGATELCVNQLRPMLAFAVIFDAVKRSSGGGGGGHQAAASR